MKIKYNSSVKVPAGWRSVEVVAIATQTSKAMVTVDSVETIDGEIPQYGQSRTGANRQKFNGEFWAKTEIGKRKRMSACVIIGETQ